MQAEPTTTLELDNAPHQRNRRWEWFAERCGLVLIAVVILAALLGLLGPGPLSHAVATSADGRLTAEHDAIQRHQAPAKLLIRCAAPKAGHEVIHLKLSRSWADRVAIEQITPEPDGVELAGDQLVYDFRISDLTGDGRIVVRFKHDEFGAVRYTIAVDDAQIQLTEFVLP